MAREDGVADFVRDHAVENPLGRSLHAHVPVEDLAAGESKCRRAAGSDLSDRGDRYLARAIPAGQFVSEPLAGQLRAKAFGRFAHLLGEFGTRRAHDEILRRVGKIGGRRRSSDRDDNGSSPVIIVILLVALAILGGILTTAVIIRRVAATEPLPPPPTEGHGSTQWRNA